MAEPCQTGLFIYFSKIIEFTTFKVVKSLTPFSQKKKILSINLFQAWGESIDWSVFDWLIRTTLLVLPLGWRRQMQGKLKAFISNTMNTMLELLTRGNRLTGMYIYIQMIVFYLVYFPWSDIGYNLHFEILDRAQLGKAYQTAGVLFEVLCAVNKTEKVEEVAPEVCPINSHCYFNLIYPGKLKVGVLLHLSFFVVAINVHNLIWCHGMHHEQIIAAARDVQEKTEIYAPYNILPLDSAGASQAIMQLEEVYILLFCCGWLTDSSILFFNA